MSWQATAWAVGQKTGAASRKALLLALANYADAEGRCWPSQQTLARDAEQSVATVQRHLRHLAELGLISINVRQRFGGHWAGRIYQLNMTPRADTVQQNEVRSEVPTGGHHTSKCSTAMLHPGRPPCVIAVTHEQTNNNHMNHHGGRRAEQGTGKRSRKQIQELQQRVVNKLGEGDKQAGWIIFGALPTHERKLLEDLEDRRALDAPAVLAARARTGTDEIARTFAILDDLEREEAQRTVDDAS